MNTLVRYFLSSLVAVSVVGCATGVTKDDILKSEWQGSLVSGLFTTRDKPLLQAFNGGMYQVRYAAEDMLVLHDFQSGKDVPVVKAPVGAHRAGVASYSDSKSLYVAWRHKLAVDSKDGLGKNGDKMVYVTHTTNASSFAAPTLISSGNGAFPPLLSGNNSGDVYAIWQDERDGGNYDLYFNVSHDYGATWKSKDMRLDVGKPAESFSAEPHLRAEGASVWLTWVEAGKQGCAVYVRSSIDRGDTWGEAVEVAKCVTGKQIQMPQIVRNKDQLEIYWYDAHNVQRSVTTTNGATWSAATTLVEVPSDGTTMQEMLVKEDASGAVHLVFGKKGGAKEDKTNLYYMKLGDAVELAVPVRLNTGGEYRDSAILATIAFDKAQNPLVAWTDYRYFRATVVGTFSGDGGKTWSKDFLLSKPTEISTSYFPHVATNGDEWWVSMVSYSGANAATMRQGATQASRLDPRAKGVAALGHAVADTSTLESRVKAFWETRLKDDWAGSYDLMDPFMRAKNAKPGYIASQGFVKYYGYEVVGFEMNGERQAKVKVKYTSEVPEMVINNKKYAVPKQEVEIVQDWIFVDGKWFLLFKDLFGSNFREL